MFHRLGRFASSHPWLVCSAWLIAGAVLALVAPTWDSRTQDDDIRFVPDRFTSVRAYRILEEAFPDEIYASRLIFAVERENRRLTKDDFKLVDQLVKDLEELRKTKPDLKITKITAYDDKVLGARLTSEDRQCTLINVSLGSPFLAISTLEAVTETHEALKKRVRSSGLDPPSLFATGTAGIGRDLIHTCGESLDGTTWATVILVIVVLLLVYRAPLLAMVPLCTIAVSVWVSLNVLALMTLIPGVHLINISKIFAIVILYGAGTDYCLFLVSRYREELRNGRRTKSAIRTSVGSVGTALAASAGTVMVGLGLMGLAEFAKVRHAGPAIALSLGIALLACLTLTPAILSIAGKIVFWPMRPPAPARSPLVRRLSLGHQGFWEWISHRVAARPVLTWSLAILVLLPFIIIGLNVTPSYNATNELSPESESLQGLAAIKRHFNPGEVGPVTVLLVTDTDWTSHDGLNQIDHLSRGFASLPNVAEVRSLTQPLGFRLPDIAPDPDDKRFLNRFFLAIKPYYDSIREGFVDHGKAHYVSAIKSDEKRHDTESTEESDSSANSSKAESDKPQLRSVTRLDVVLHTDPFDDASKDTLVLIKTWLDKELPRTSILSTPIQAECYGVTANSTDLASLTENDRTRVNWLVIAAIFVILLILVRRPWLAGYLLLTVLLSYFAALGATVLVGTLWNGRPLDHVDWRVPFFLFTILVAVGEDYNILLISRAMQERKRYGAVEGMRRALARTGGTITSCGLIMAGTFATLMLAGLSSLMQIGFALAFGVLIDTFIVRPFLVPAIGILFWTQKKAVVPKLSWDDDGSHLFNDEKWKQVA